MSSPILSSAGVNVPYLPSSSKPKAPEDLPYQTDRFNPLGLSNLSPADRMAMGNRTRPEGSLGYALGQMLRGVGQSAMGGVDNLWNRSPSAAALATAIPLGLLGAGGAWLYNRFADRQVSPLAVGAASAAAGAGLGAYAAYQRKAAAWRDGDDSLADIAQMLAVDNTLTQKQKADAINALPSLDTISITQLESLIRTAGGAAIGAIVMRFLVGKGLMPMAVGAVIGGLLSRPSSPTNAFGKPILGDRGFFG